MAGELLKKKREELGLDIKELSDILKISSEYLTAIENDNFEKLPVPVYTIGYIRCYAKYLNMDAGPVIKHFNSQLSSPKPSTIIPIACSRKQVPVYLYLIFFSMAGLLAFAVYASRHERQSGAEIAGTVNASITEDRILADAAMTQPGESETLREDVEVSDENAPVTSLPGDSISIKTPAPGGPSNEKQMHETVPLVVEKPDHQLGITASEDAWLRIVFDSGKAEEVLLRPGVSKVWKFKGSAVLKIGNAGGVNLKFDGEDLGVPGAPGQVLNLNFPRM